MGRVAVTVGRWRRVVQWQDVEEEEALPRNRMQGMGRQARLGGVEDVADVVGGGAADGVELNGDEGEVVSTSGRRWGG